MPFCVMIRWWQSLLQNVKEYRQKCMCAIKRKVFLGGTKKSCWQCRWWIRREKARISAFIITSFCIIIIKILHIQQKKMGLLMSTLFCVHYVSKMASNRSNGFYLLKRCHHNDKNYYDEYDDMALFNLL